MSRVVGVEAAGGGSTATAVHEFGPPAGQGLALAMTLRAPAALAETIRAHPGECDSIIAWLHQHRGGELVREVVDQLQARRLIAAQAETLLEAALTLDGQIDFDLEIQEQTRATRDASFAGWTSEAMASAGESVGRLWNRVRGEPNPTFADADVELPSRDAWAPARHELALGRDLLARARAKEAAGDLAGAELDFDDARAALDRGRVSYLEARRRLSEYRARIQGGMAHNVTLAHGVEGACLTIAGAATGAWVGGVLAAGVAAGTGTTVLGVTIGGPLTAGGIATVASATAATTFAVRATTETAAQAGAGQAIDPLHVFTVASEEALATLVTGFASGALGVLFGKVLGAAVIEAADRLGCARVVQGIGDPKAIADQVVMLIGGVSGSSIVSAARTAVLQHLHGTPVTAAELAGLVVHELTVNGIIQTAVLGLSRSLAARSSIDDAAAYAEELNQSRGHSITRDAERPSSYQPATNAVNLGEDLATAAGGVDPRGVVAHEIVGHGDAATTALRADGTSATATNRHPDLEVGSTVEEMQASYRAALRAPDLTADQRLALIRDGNARRRMLADDEVYIWADEAVPGDVTPDLAPALGDGELQIDLLAASRRVLRRGTPDIPVIQHTEVLTEQFAHAAYNWSGDATASLASRNGYVQGPVIDGAHDLAFRVFMPSVPGKPPIIAFRGTVPTKVGGLIADLDPDGIGALQFDENRELIRQAIADATATAGPAVMTGHSLGGALAQLTAAEFPEAAREVITFASPGINPKAVAALRAHNAAHPDARIDSIHHQIRGDLVSDSGAELTDGMLHIHETVSASNPVSKHASAILGSNPELNEGYDLPAAYLRGSPTRLRTSLPVGDHERGATLETLRRTVGGSVFAFLDWWSR